MAPRGPPFDFDLNEPPPPEDDAPAAGPDPAPQRDPAPEPSPQRDPPPAPVPAEPSPHGQAPAADASTEDPLAAPAPEPSPYDSLHPPSPVLDLEAPLSSLDDDDECGYEDEAELPPPPPLPLPPPPPLSCVSSPGFQGATTPPWAAASQSPAPHSSHEASPPRGPSRERAASDSRSLHGSRRWPSSCGYDSRDDAVSKQRRVDYERSGAGGRRSEPGSSPRRYERAGLASPRPYEQGGRRHVPAMHAPPRNRRRRRRQPRPQHGNQYQVPVQRQQGFRGQERPQARHGPDHGPEVPEVGYAAFDPSWSRSFVGWNSSGARLSPKQEPTNGNGGYHHHQQQQRREAPPLRPSSRPHGGEGPYHGRQSQVQGPIPPKIGGYQHREEAPSFRPSTGAAHGRDGSSGGVRQRPAQQPISNGGAFRQRKAPRGREDLPGRQYHPYGYACDGGVFDRTGGGNQDSRCEPPPRPDYEHRRTSGGPAARGRQYYGDVQK
ncbi:hypothetical protein BS78_09G159100 [Paspalum vaginatum]|nr:hypothetical protein BS78_09G159100 [Paspalum vaginatum]